MSDALYAAALPLIEERGNQVVFGGTPEGCTWAAFEDDPCREFEGAEIVIDRRFWMLLGKPKALCVGFSAEAGWQKWVGTPPSRPNIVGAWLQSFEGGEV
jgi:hypothetical protein